MNWTGKIAISAVLAFSWQVCAADSQLYQDSFEREFALKSLGELSITNARGEIAIEAWSQDRVRVSVVRRVTAATEEEAKKVRGNGDMAFRSSDRGSELVAEYGRGLTIEERLKERDHPLVVMDLTIRVPSRVPLRVYGMASPVSVKGLNAALVVRTLRGPIQIESVKGGPIEAYCPQCPISLRSVNSAARCMGGSGAIQLSSVQGGALYVESDSGNVTADDSDGEQLYVTHSGTLTGTRMRGRIEFHSGEGDVKISDSSGFLSGMTESGKIEAEMKTWKFMDKALIESIDGSVTLVVPAKFSGDVDLRSGSGKVFSAFPLTQLAQPLDKKHESLPMRPLSRLMGLVGEGGEQLKLASEKGDVRLLNADLQNSATR